VADGGKRGVVVLGRHLQHLGADGAPDVGGLLHQHRVGAGQRRQDHLPAAEEGGIGVGDAGGIERVVFPGPLRDRRGEEEIALQLALQARQVPLLLVVIAIVVGYVGYTGTGLDTVGLRGVTQTQDSIKARQKSIDSLVILTDSAKRLLAKGSVEDLRRRLEGYRYSLELMRRLVPDRNEVANLMDEISTRAKIRGVMVAQFQPLPTEPGPAPFETYKYQYSVIGRYDQLGEFLSDVASLQRIIVPVDLTLGAADMTRAKALGDSSGALLEARFQIRTYVKTASSEDKPSGT